MFVTAIVTVEKGLPKCVLYVQLYADTAVTPLSLLEGWHAPKITHWGGFMLPFNIKTTMKGRQAPIKHLYSQTAPWHTERKPPTFSIYEI